MLPGPKFQGLVASHWTALRGLFRLCWRKKGFWQLAGKGWEEVKGSSPPCGTRGAQALSPFGFQTCTTKC